MSCVWLFFVDLPPCPMSIFTAAFSLILVSGAVCILETKGFRGQNYFAKVDVTSVETSDFLNGKKTKSVTLVYTDQTSVSLWRHTCTRQVVFDTSIEQSKTTTHSLHLNSANSSSSSSLPLPLTFSFHLLFGRPISISLALTLFLTLPFVIIYDSLHWHHFVKFEYCIFLFTFFARSFQSIHLRN